MTVPPDFEPIGNCNYIEGVKGSPPVSAQPGDDLAWPERSCPASTKLPQTPAETDAVRIASFDNSSRVPSSNAGVATNNDIVNPIAQNQRAPRTCRQGTSAGAIAILASRLQQQNRALN